MFQVDFSSCKGIFGVPNEVVDEHLNLSGALSLKVLLILLRHGRPMEASELAAMLNQTEGDVRDALNIWVGLGLVKAPGETKEIKATQALNQGEQTNVAPSKTQSEAVTKKNDKVDDKVKIRKERFYRMTRHEVNEVAQSDNNIGVLLEESQNILARPLSSGESETLVSLYHHYGMDLSIILTVLQYCKSIEKDSPAYYEKMALDWFNREINTHERAEQEILKLTETENKERDLRKVFGIYNRAVSKRELEFFTIWTEDLGFSLAMLRLAYERTIDAKGSLSFHYINAILRSWKEKNIKTPQEAEMEAKARSSANNQQNGKSTPDSNASYDLEELERIISQGSVWD